MGMIANYQQIADEKLQELKELKEIIEEDTYQTEKFLQNRQLFSRARSGINHTVQKIARIYLKILRIYRKMKM